MILIPKTVVPFVVSCEHPLARTSKRWRKGEGGKESRRPMCDVAVSTAQNSCTVAILRAHSSIGSAGLPLRLRETWDSDS